MVESEEMELVLKVSVHNDKLGGKCDCVIVFARPYSAAPEFFKPKRSERAVFPSFSVIGTRKLRGNVDGKSLNNILLLS